MNLITREEEQVLLEAYCLNGCQRSLRAIFKNNEPFIRKMTMGFVYPSNPDFEDFLQEGRTGFMEALNKYNPAENASIRTYASFYIRNRVLTYRVDNEKIVKPVRSKGMKKLLLRGNLFCGKQKSLTSAQIDKISTELEVTRSEVLEAEQYFGTQGCSLDGLLSNDGGHTLQEMLPSSEVSVEDEYILNESKSSEVGSLLECISRLSDRYQVVVRSRFLHDEDEKPKTLRELSEELGVSGERIRQIEGICLDKMKNDSSLRSSCFN